MMTICQFWPSRSRISRGCGWLLRPAALGKFRRLLQRTTQDEQERNDQAADQERNAPAPCEHRLGRHDHAQQHAKERDENDGDLLAAGLPTDIEALVARCCDLCEIDRHAAELGAGGKTFDQPAITTITGASAPSVA